MNKSRVRREAKWTREAMRTLDRLMSAEQYDAAHIVMQEIAGVWGTLAEDYKGGEQ